MATEENFVQKKEWKDKHLRWICALANSGGGKLVVGAAGRDPSGLAKAVRERAAAALGIRCKAKPMMHMGEPVVAVTVPASPLAVWLAGSCHVLDDNGCSELKGEALDAFLLSRRGLRWDSVPAAGATLEDLSPEAIERFRVLARLAGRIDSHVLAKPAGPLLERLHLVAGSRPTNAAMVLFSADPELWQPGTYIKIGLFGEETGARREEVVRGPLAGQVERALDLLSRKYLPGAQPGAAPDAPPPVSMTALKELLVNAVAHKDYLSAVPVQVRVSEDGVRISNRACLPDRWDAAAARKTRASDPPNPALAQILYLAGLADMWGSGLQNVRQSSLAARAPEPEYEVSQHMFMVRLPSAPAAPTTQQAAPATEPPASTSRPVVPRNPPAAASSGHGKLEAVEQRILDILRTEPRTTGKALGSQIGLSTTSAYRYLRRLNKKGYILRVDATKGHWQVLDIRET